MHGLVLMVELFANEVIDVAQQLGEGQARCEFCQGDYSVQLEVVCADCERPLCPLCATRSRRIYRCPECRPTGRVALPSCGRE
jgi:hypothetical protein